MPFRCTLSVASSLFLCVALWVQAGLAQTPPVRLLRFDATDPRAARDWQQAARITLAVLLQIDHQIAANRHDDRGRSPLALRPVELSAKDQEKYTRYELQIDSRPDRQINVVLTIPTTAATGRTPAVVCIHGHGGDRDMVYTADSPYRGFATTLAENGYVTLSTDVGQHAVQSEHGSLMGERLWDLIRVVDLAASRPEVDPRRIGCAGLSLGGEMAMWLGAMDMRIVATVSSGFLTTMENLRVGHCQCWDFPGLQRRYDFADVYSLIGPRPLQCQNGQQERLPGGFPVDVAQTAMAQIKRAYRVLSAEDAAELVGHPEGHVFDVPAAVRFLDAALKAGE